MRNERRTRASWESLERLYFQRESLLVQGKSTAEVDKEIVSIKRRQRQGTEAGEGDLFNGRYRLIEEIGHGGFAVVWKAFDRVGQRLVAVKILHSEQGDDQRRVERFERGARQMQGLDHPHIVRLLDGPLEHEELHYFVMDYLGGGDLHRAVLANRLNRAAALRAVLQVGAALEYAHQHGLVHRDVKPQNILLDEQGAAHLTDFDLVWAADTTGGTRTGAMGTFLFSAPEEMEDASRVDRRADVYSLGMTTVFVLYGKNLTRRVLDARLRFIETLDCSPAVRALLRQATDPDLRARPATVKEFCRALHDAVQSELGDLQPLVPDALSEAPKRRSWRWLLPTAVAGIVLVGGGIWWRRPIWRHDGGISPTPSRAPKDITLPSVPVAPDSVKQAYERFEYAAKGRQYNRALIAYGQLPEGSTYRQLGRDRYVQMVALFVEDHLKAADLALSQGDCSSFRNQLQIVLVFDRNNAQALAMEGRPCSPSTDSRRAPLELGTPNAELSLAQTEYVNGNYSKAIEMAKAVQKDSPVRAWRIIGSAACNLKDLKLVNDAYDRLDSAGRQYLVYVCQRNGIQSTGNQFKFVESDSVASHK